MSKYEELLDRVKAATAPDRGLSADIHHALLGEETPYYDTLHSTGSTDAAFALVDRTLRDLVISMTRLGDKSGMVQVTEAWLADTGIEVIDAFSPLDPMTPPLSVLAALLIALGETE